MNCFCFDEVCIVFSFLCGQKRTKEPPRGTLPIGFPYGYPSLKRHKGVSPLWNPRNTKFYEISNLYFLFISFKLKGSGFALSNSILRVDNRVAGFPKEFSLWRGEDIRVVCNSWETDIKPLLKRFFSSFSVRTEKDIANSKPIKTKPGHTPPPNKRNFSLQPIFILQNLCYNIFIK